MALFFHDGEGISPLGAGQPIRLTSVQWFGHVLLGGGARYIYAVFDLRAGAAYAEPRHSEYRRSNDQRPAEQRL